MSMAAREIDLTAEPGQALDQAQFARQATQAQQDVQSVARSQEQTRRDIAYGLLGLLRALAIAGVVTMFVESLDVERVKDVLGIVFTSVVGLVGSVVGFYFGARTAEAAGGSDQGSG